VSKAALERGVQQVWLLDPNPRVSDPRILICEDRAENLRGGQWNPLDEDECCYPHREGRWYTDCRSFIDSSGARFVEKTCNLTWNLVVCRQAIGYLDLPLVARKLHEVVEPHGRFVFNTFVKPKFSLRLYEHGGRFYVEASGHLGKRVMHLQATDGDFDVTAFRWWTEREIFRAFASGWALEDYKRTEASLWYSFRREPS
jgi:hypothetical protein